MELVSFSPSFLDTISIFLCSYLSKLNLPDMTSKFLPVYVCVDVNYYTYNNFHTKFVGAFN
jgi:hypothetical protein